MRATLALMVVLLGGCPSSHSRVLSVGSDGEDEAPPPWEDEPPGPRPRDPGPIVARDAGVAPSPRPAADGGPQATDRRVPRAPRQVVSMAFDGSPPTIALPRPPLADSMFVLAVGVTASELAIIPPRVPGWHEIGAAHGDGYGVGSVYLFETRYPEAAEVGISFADPEAGLFAILLELEFTGVVNIGLGGTNVGRTVTASEAAPPPGTAYWIAAGASRVPAFFLGGSPGGGSLLLLDHVETGAGGLVVYGGTTDELAPVVTFPAVDERGWGDYAAVLGWIAAT